METNLNGGTDEITRPENAKQSGRRRSKLNDPATQKKKQPQRGMGVAQLERLRMQESRSWKMNPLHSLSLHQNHQFANNASSSFADPSVQMHLAKLGSYGASQTGFNQALLLQRLGTGGFQVDPYGFRASSSSSHVGGVIETTSREVCKIPNVKCYSEMCGACHKKKRIFNGGNSVCDGRRKMYTEMSQISDCNFTRFNVRNTIGENQEFVRNQEAEVVAVHRKGINTGGGGGGGVNNVVMEYEFFPGKGSGSRRSNSEEELTKIGSECSSVSGGEGYCASKIGALTTSSTGGGFDPSTCVDLSLKLSY